jgi:deazaflavin-dependent oxidoreductase (nitroreductase family)
MSGNRTAGSSLVTAAEWFAGGGRILYDPESARVVTEEDAAATPGGVRVNASSNRVPAWWLNLQAEPHAEILVNRTSHNVIARPATPTEDDILWAQFARLNPGYDEYRQLTERRIPVIILEPRVQNDAAGHDHST